MGMSMNVPDSYKFCQEEALFRKCRYIKEIYIEKGMKTILQYCKKPDERDFENLRVPHRMTSHLLERDA